MMLEKQIWLVSSYMVCTYEFVSQIDVTNYYWLPKKWPIMFKIRFMKNQSMHLGAVVLSPYEGFTKVTANFGLYSTFECAPRWER